MEDARYVQEPEEGRSRKSKRVKAEKNVDAGDR